VIAVLTFDSASVVVIERMLEAGKLPALASLRQRGRQIQLQTPARDFAAGAFYTLYSGVELGEHGIFYPFQWDPAGQRARYATAFEAPPAIWERLAPAGVSALVIDPYECRPPGAINGTALSGIGFQERVVLPAWSRPRGARARMALRHGRARRATEVFGRPRPNQLLRLRSRLEQAPERVAQAAIEQLRRRRFDLVWLTFSASHLAGHQFWDLSQLESHDLDRESRALLASALEDVYRAVDRAIASVLRALPDSCDVIVTSAVGMDVNTSRADLLPGMLEAVLGGRPIERGEAGSVWRLRAAVPPGLRAAVAGALPRRVSLELTSRLELSGLDWARTRAFAHPADNQGYIRLNLRGREARGIVDPGEAEALVEEIATGLAEFEDLDGGPAVAAVERVAGRYPGAQAERLPDLVVRWSERAATSLKGVRARSFGEVMREGVGSGRSGNHTPGDAWALVAPASSRHREPSRPARLADVAATVAAALEQPPAGLRGEPLLVGGSRFGRHAADDGELRGDDERAHAQAGAPGEAR
jgi:predicted AlkP superfamily phosphohydrolase/phosphomutase